MRKVKWSIRDDGNSTWCKHFHGEYVVTVTDMDGDMTEWNVWTRKEWEREVPDDELWKERRLAWGTVVTGDELDIAQAIAIEALDAIIRDRQ